MIKDKTILVVGAGISGLTCANILSLYNKITILLQRDVIGGNCYDYYDNNHLIHKYGAHLFHTNNKIV